MEPGAPVYRFFCGLDERLLAVAKRNPRQIIATHKMHDISLNIKAILCINPLGMVFA
jgi:hypothetical protein